MTTLLDNSVAADTDGVDDFKSVVADVIEIARQQGASQAEAGASGSSGLAVTARMGDVETIEHTRDKGLGVTVYFGQRKGSASTTDISPAALKDTVLKACTIARNTMEDDCAGIAEAALMASEIPDLDLDHPWSLNVDDAIERAIACEDAARGADPRITNSEGATVNTQRGHQVYGNSHGFIGGYSTTRHGISCAVIGEQDGAMQRDYWYSSARAAGDMQNGSVVGRTAAQHTLARLGARGLGTRNAPVIFRADVASSLWRSLIGAIRGSSLYRGASFLLDHLDKQVFPDFVRVSEQPLLKRGLGSAPYDSEGVATRPKDIVSDGILRSYLLSSYSARKLGMTTTGNAGGIRNLVIDSGGQDLNGMMRSMGRGLIVTEMMGQGVNLITGDYSRGASGFWVENGEILYPVEEITIAGNLRDMFMNIQEIGSDIDRRGNILSGSVLLGEMTIAGNAAD